MTTSLCSKSVQRVVIWIVTSLCALISISAQDEPVEKIETAILRIPVFVSDSKGVPVKGLTENDFQLLVDGKPREIDYFADSGPVTVALVIDSNSNTADVLDQIRRDAQDFVELLGPDDRAMVIRFDIGYRVVCELTADKAKLRRAIGGIDSSRERVRLMKAVVHQVVFRELAAVQGRKGIVLFADPDSNLPEFNWKNVPSYQVDDRRRWVDYRNLTASDAVVYPVFYQTATFPREFLGKTMTSNELIKIPGIDYYNSFATLTGGRLLLAGASNFRSARQLVLDEIRNQYTLSIYVDPIKGQKSAVSIRVNRPDVVVRSKQRVDLESQEGLQSRIKELWKLRTN